METDDFAGPEPIHVRLQIDWLPQIESGGYYQARARGFYRDLGLDVEIVPGGPGVAARANVADGNADLGATDGNSVIVAVAHGLPLMIVGAEMQRSPVGLMYHRTRPLRTFRDLDGRILVANSTLAWVDFLQQTQRVRFDLRPNLIDLTGFVADESLVRQCFVTQEPFVAEKMGAEVGTLLLADAGYDPYRAVFTTDDFAQRHPEVVRRFLAATIAGYTDLIAGDPEPAFAAILAANPAMTREVMRHSLDRMREMRLVEGRTEEGERPGRIVSERIGKDIEQLLALGLLDRSVSIREVARFDLVPIAGDFRVGTTR